MLNEINGALGPLMGRDVYRSRDTGQSSFSNKPRFKGCGNNEEREMDFSCRFFFSHRKKALEMPADCLEFVIVASS